MTYDVRLCGERRGNPHWHITVGDHDLIYGPFKTEAEAREFIVELEKRNEEAGK